MTELSALTTDELIADLDDQLMYHGISYRMSEYTSELSRRLSAAERAEKELAEASEITSEAQGACNKSRDFIAGLEARVAELERENAEDRAARYAQVRAAESERDRLRAAMEYLHERLSGWETREWPRDTFQPRRCSVEKGTGLALRVIARDFTYEQAEAVEAFIDEMLRLARRALSAGSET